MPAVDEKKRKRKRARKFRTAGVDGMPPCKLLRFLRLVEISKKVANICLGEAAPAGDDSGSEPEVAAKVVENKEKKQKKNRAAVDEVCRSRSAAYWSSHTCQCL